MNTNVNGNVISNDLVDVQRKILDVYKEIKRVCDEHDLRYFAIGGTGIGAARHKGFIPWDDDIDIVMPRRDYYLFKEIASKQLPHHMQFSDLADSDKSLYVFGKVSDTSTTYVAEEDIDDFGAYNGVFIDIMPLDGVPEEYIKYQIHMRLLEVIMRINSAVMYAKLHDDVSGFKCRLKKYLGRIWGVFFSNTSLKRRYVALASKYQFDESKYLARTWLVGSHDGLQAKARYFQEDFDGHVDMPFEDTIMRMPKGYDRYLSALYPNYMTLPPKEKQVPRHSGGIVDLGHSYRYHVAKREGKKIGYTAGCYDLFHIGHMNLLRRAKNECDYLIVGVNADEAMYSYKQKYPVIPEDERIDIVAGLRCVDEVVLVTDTDKYEAYKKHEYDVIFVGDDHKGEPTWIELEDKLAKKDSKVHYFGYTKHISSSKLRENLRK